MKIIFSILIILFSLNVNAQKNISVACTDFTFNSKKNNDGKNITYIFESALTKSNTLIKVLERKNLDYVLSKAEEEKNLANDFGEKTIKGLVLAGVDYAVSGNILISSGIDTATMCICFTKISGKDVTTKHTISIFVNKEDLNNFAFLETKIIEKLKEIPFDEKLGLIEKDQMEEINKQFKEKDERIKELELQDQNRKSEELKLKLLKSTAPEVDINFVLTQKKDSFAFEIISKNHIPIKYTVAVVNAIDEQLMGDNESIVFDYSFFWYPREFKNPTLIVIYCGKSKYNFSKEVSVKLKVIFAYRSIYYEEMHYEKKLENTITKFYTFNPLTNEIKNIEN